MSIPLTLSDRCLVFFVDDTGHEALVSGHSTYGLGGCASLGRDIEHRIRAPWREIRKRVTRSPSTPLHASKFPALATSSDMEAVANYFRISEFYRFAAIMTNQTELTNEISLMRTMKGAIQNRVVEIAGRTLCKEVKIIFESSDRANAQIREAFKDF